MSDYPWRLRLVHEGHSAIRVERPGRWLHFDPYAIPDDEGLCVLTWQELERARGVQAALAQGRDPDILALGELHGWLTEQGATCLFAPPEEWDGVRIEAEPYTPIPYATPIEAVRKVRSGLLHPARAARRLYKRLRTPSAPPAIVQLSFPDGSRLLHLNCSLHQDTPADWLAAAQERYRGADWLIVGVDFGEDEAVLERIPGFEAKIVHVADLVNATRESIGLPTRHLTPVVDRLVAQGIVAQPFVEGATVRYE